MHLAPKECVAAALGVGTTAAQDATFVPLFDGQTLAGSTLTLAMADPLDFETVAALRSFSGLEIQTVLASEQEVLDALADVPT